MERSGQLHLRRNMAEQKGNKVKQKTLTSNPALPLKRRIKWSKEIKKIKQASKKQNKTKTNTTTKTMLSY